MSILRRSVLRKSRKRNGAGRLLAGGAVVGAAVWLMMRARRYGSGCGLGSKLQTDGTLDNWKGRAKQFVGDATGNGSTTAEGTADRVIGAVRTGVSKVASALVEGAPARQA